MRNNRKWNGNRIYVINSQSLLNKTTCATKTQVVLLNIKHPHKDIHACPYMNADDETPDETVDEGGGVILE